MRMAAQVFALQWSHVLTNVETERARSRPVPGRRASMEPRPHERGNPGRGRALTRSSSSFNGATSSRTWKPLAVEQARENLEELQWSHVLTNVETCHTYFGHRTCLLSLQWSHVLTNVETARIVAMSIAAFVASMELRPHERGNPTHLSDRNT